MIVKIWIVLGWDNFLTGSKLAASIFRVAYGGSRFFQDMVTTPPDYMQPQTRRSQSKYSP
jgi:hypothetical protein